MNKNIFFYLVIGIAGFYFLTNFLGDMQSKDERIQNDDYQKAHRFDNYNTKDSIGQNILDLTGTDSQVQIEAWNKSLLREEYLSLFPNFSAMKQFIDDRLRGDAVKAKLLHKLNSVEDNFFSGAISMEKAKRELRYLK